MNRPEIIQQKIFTLPEIILQVNRLRLLSKTISFTNGCFDILHPGHIASLSQAAKEGSYLIVGVNTDESVRRLKGPNRPINPQDSRVLLLASLLMVDAVVLFNEDTPLELITAILPDVIVKGGDYTIEQVVGSKLVLANGGRVVINPIVEGFSTSALIEKIHGL